MTHQQIDMRSLAMAEAIVDLIDGDPERRGLQRARSTCERWLRECGPDRNVEEWQAILTQGWDVVRAVLLDESEEGCRLRQNSPFAGVLPPKVRWDIYRKFRDEQFKYYAHGVGPETATLPEGWRDRLVPIQNEHTGSVKALCLHPVDIAASKLVAGRDKDIAYVKVMLNCGILLAAELTDAVAKLPGEKRMLAQQRSASMV